MDIIVFENFDPDGEKISIPAHKLSIGKMRRMVKYDWVYEPGWSRVILRREGGDSSEYCAPHPRETVQRAVSYFVALQEADRKSSFPSLVLPKSGARNMPKPEKVMSRTLDLTTTPISIEEMLEIPGESGHAFVRRIDLSFTVRAEPGKPAPVSASVAGSRDDEIECPGEDEDEIERRHQRIRGVLTPRTERAVFRTRL